MMLHLVCHVNVGNEKCITWVQGCIRIHSQQPFSRLYWIKSQHPWLKRTHHTKVKEPHNEIQISLKANQSHLLKSVIAYDFPTRTDVIVIKLIPSMSSWGKHKYHPTQKKTSYLRPHDFMEDTIRQSISQMTPTSKACVPCLLVIIIKWCHMITRNRL